MANSNIETSFQNLVNVIKKKTAPISHQHTTSQITDFPESMPASDVYEWAKASTKPTYNASEVGAFSATDGANLQQSVVNIELDITDLAASKIGISQIGMANGVASLGLDGKVPDSQLPEISGGGGIVRSFSSFTFNKGGFYGDNVWTDGTDIYQSNGSSQWVLNQSDLTWSDKTWNGYTSIIGAGVWKDGTNIYYSNNANQYVLDKATSTWSAKTWSGLTSFQGGYIWTDGTDIYYSNGTQQWVLDKSTSTWSAKTWTGLTNFTGNNVWSDGENIYYSNNTAQYVLDKSTSTWTTKTWSGVTGITGSKIWKDGTKIHYSNTAAQAVLDKTLNAWNDENWFGDITSLDGTRIWHFGTEIFYSNGSTNGHLVDYDLAQMLEQNNGIATLGSNGRLKETQTYYVSAGKKSGTTLGSNATAEGSSNIASANNTHAEGYSTQATESSAHSEGAGTKATGENSHAEGWDTLASHKASHSSGYQTITGRTCQFVAGTANVGSSDTLFEVGDGTSTSDRHNVFEVKDKNGKIKIGDTLISTIPTGAHGSGSQTTYQPNTTNSTPHPDYTGYWVKFIVGSTTMKEGLIPQTFEGITVDTTTTTADGTNEDTIKVVVYTNLLTEGGIVVDGEVIDGNGNTLSAKANSSSLGTAAALNVAASGNASTTEVVKGDDSRLTDSRTPTSHTHTTSDISNFPTLGTAAAKNITISTTDLTPGTSALTTGDIYIVYEA